MSDFQPLIVCNEESTAQKIARLNFVEGDIDDFGFSVDQALECLVFQLLKKPRALAVHLQRIYFCYHNGLTENLFAALVDLFIILEGKGHNLSLRMLQGAKSKLQPQQYAILNKALNLSAEEVKLLSGNMYSLFSYGLIGTNLLIVKEENQKQQEHDPLDIARDFIAYSQLDAAIETLENAILLDIGRQELHDDLLELYKVTQDFERFKEMYEVLSRQVEIMPAAWEELKGFFNG
jgi:tetratricopeptide (TPR) repeat protein